MPIPNKTGIEVIINEVLVFRHSDSLHGLVLLAVHACKCINVGKLY